MLFTFYFTDVYHRTHKKIITTIKKFIKNITYYYKLLYINLT